MKDDVKRQEKAISEIIERYGSTLNLKESPYIIAEILRQYGGIFNSDPDPHTGPIPGSHGVPPPPPPSPGSIDFKDRFELVFNELKYLSKSIDQINGKVDRLFK